MKYQNYFFIGVAGSGMSAIAQFLAQKAYFVAGSDRQFSSLSPIQEKLAGQNIYCYPQDGSGISAETQCVVVSTAIEDDNPDILKAKELNIPIMHRAELLAEITTKHKTIAIAGTSGKSTVTGMVWHILKYAKQEPSLITGAGLSELEKTGIIGNGVAGMGQWLVIEADESDGSLVNYHPEIGAILNLDKDHKEIPELVELFKTFAANTKQTLVVNGDHEHAKQFSRDKAWEFGSEGWQGFQGVDFKAEDTNISFRIRSFGKLVKVVTPVPGRHNMENAQAAVACAVAAGVNLRTAAEALATWGGIHRRHQVVGSVQGVKVIDDYAHNPAKISASIDACQDFTPGKIIAWYQPHGFAPTKFLRQELVQALAESLLKPSQENLLYISDIYYAGGTAQTDISSSDLVEDLQKLGVNAVYVPQRQKAIKMMVQKAFSGDTILLMGARDPSLGDFAQKVFLNLQDSNTCV
ncbi:MAG: Mur ligase [Fibrobacter sp.]|nr:Mur ligase [Fibrobacter sp.]